MRNVLGAFLCTAMLVACGNEAEQNTLPAQPPVEGVEVEEVSDAFLKGSLPESPHISGYAELAYDYNNSHMTSMRLTMETSGGRAVMAIFQIEGGNLDHEDLAVGSEFSIRPGEDTEGGLNFNVIGCEGQRFGQWEFDDHADVIDIRVDQITPNIRRLNFTGSFVNYQTDEVMNFLDGHIDLQE